MVSPTPPPRVGLHHGGRLHPVIPVRLHGDRASLVIAEIPAEGDDVRLVLDWSSGAVTELRVDVRSVESPRRVAHLDIRGVHGDWQPFLEYLGERRG